MASSSSKDKSMATVPVGSVPSWVPRDVARHLPPSLVPQAIVSTVPLAGPHERPTHFQSSQLHQPARGVTHPSQVPVSVTSPWGPRPHVTTNDPSKTYQNHAMLYNAQALHPESNKKRRRVRKRPKRVVTSSSSSSSSMSKARGGNRHRGDRHDGNDRHVDSMSGYSSETFGVKTRGARHQQCSDELPHGRRHGHDDQDHYTNEYHGPQFVPVVDRSSSDWGTVPAKELKWTRRRGSYDLFPDFKNPSHHTTKIVHKRRGCC